MKKFLLLAACFAAGSLGTLRAQTDVTSTYLTNADFSQTTALDNGLCGYGKDMGGKGTTYYGLQAVDGWTSVVVSGDNTNATYPNSGMGGAVFAYGSDYLMMGNNTKAPAAGPDDEAGNCLGFFAVWDCGGYYYQDVTFPAGKYTITVPMYSQSGTQNNTTYTGFFPTSGTNRTVAVNPTVGQWVNQTVTFTLTDETAGQIRVGYKSTGSGSGANPMLYFDGVKIEYTAAVVKDVLSTALSAATTANATLNSSDLAAAIATAQSVYDSNSATQDEVNSAAATLNAATELAMSAAGDVTGLFLSNPGFESSNVTTTNAPAGANAAPVDIAGGWSQVSSAAWSSSAVVAYGGSGQVNGVSAPSADNAGNSGNALGVSVGWGGLVTYQSKAIILPAGVYTLQVNAYNNLEGVTQFASKFGFVPTTGASTLSSKNSFAYDTWVEDKVTFTLNEATEGKIQIGGQAISGGSGANAKVFFDNITITYQSFLAGAKATYDEAVAAAEEAKAVCMNVTGEELTALNDLLNAAEPSTVDGYNEAAEAIEAATATLTAAKAAYDAYYEIHSIAVVLDLEPGAAPANAAAAPAATHALNVAIYNLTTAGNIFDVTEVYNPSWSNMTTSSGQHWSGDASISYADNWSGDMSVTERSATFTLPAGSYILMSAGRGSGNVVATMSANGTAVTFASNGDLGLGINKLGAASFDPEDAAGFSNKSGQPENTGTGWEWRYIPVTLAEETEVTAVQTLTRLSGSSWGSFSDFRILKQGVVATSDDYAALNSAISDAEAKTLGFNADQYAPYNNVTALEALAAAKAIDQEAKNDQEVVQALTAALNGVTWEANADLVDIVYNGCFDVLAEGQNYPEGWTRTNGWGQQQTGLEGDFETAYYNQPGSLQYGNNGVYTMPLEANEWYQLFFSYRSHENGSNHGVTASVLNAEDGLAALQFTANGSTSEWRTASAYFQTGAAGNYVLTLENAGNTWITNVQIVSHGQYQMDGYFNEALGIYEDETIDELFYPNLTLARDFVGEYKWSTLVVPFDITNAELEAAFGVDVEVAEFSENSENADEVTVNFTKMETPEIKANTPVLVKSKASVSEIELSNKLVLLRGEESARVEGSNIDFQGVYFYTDADTETFEQPFIIPAGDYFIGNGALYKSAGATTIKPFRAYLHDKTGGAAQVKLFIDGIATSISEIADTQLTTDNAAIFNLAGQRVQKTQKGLYIINGQKVISK